MSARRNRNMDSGLVGGTIIVVVGVIFLLDNLGLVSVGHLFRFWPMLLILGGLASLLSPQERVKGTVLLVLGVLFQLDALGIAHLRWSSLWPLAIIGAGVMVMWGTLQSRGAGGGGPIDLRTTLNEFALFGGGERRITTQDFQGGSITAIFGGFEIDLRQADIRQQSVELTINAIFGGVEIRVPQTWEVLAHGQGMFGGYDDKTSFQDLAPDASPDKPRKTLLLHGLAMFGGVEIKN